MRELTFHNPQGDMRLVLDDQLADELVERGVIARPLHGETYALARRTYPVEEVEALLAAVADLPCWDCT